MANIKFNHKSIDKVIQLDTGIICVHYKDDTDIQTFHNWKEFLQAHPNVLYEFNVTWSKIKSFLSSLNIFTKKNG